MDSLSRCSFFFLSGYDAEGGNNPHHGELEEQPEKSGEAHTEGTTNNVIAWGHRIKQDANATMRTKQPMHATMGTVPAPIFF